MSWPRRRTAKGRRYGTLLVDVETRRPVDILEDRSSDSFANAVTNGLSLPWSSGAVEGHVNRIQDAQTANVRTR